jgi:hypothetical protein
MLYTQKLKTATHVFIKRFFKKQLSGSTSASISPVPSPSAEELVKLEEGHMEPPTASYMSSQVSCLMKGLAPSIPKIY